MPTLTVRGVELHQEVRGDGPPAVFIIAASGDGGHFQTLPSCLVTGSPWSPTTGLETGAAMSRRLRLDFSEEQAMTQPRCSRPSD
jgi:hypothetical protein